MVFTTNKHPKRWGPVLHDDDLAEAIVDRILDTSLNDDQDDPGDRRVSGASTAEFPEPTRGTARRSPVNAIRSPSWPSGSQMTAASASVARSNLRSSSRIRS